MMAFGWQAGAAKLMGHALWTNAEAERSTVLTLLVWACFAACFYLALGTLPE
jgi:hypothetical protein